MPQQYKQDNYVQNLGWLERAQLSILNGCLAFARTPRGVYTFTRVFDTLFGGVLPSVDINPALADNSRDLLGQRAIVLGYIDGADKLASVPEDSLLIGMLGIAAKRLDRVSGL